MKISLAAEVMGYEVAAALIHGKNIMMQVVALTKLQTCKSILLSTFSTPFFLSQH